jgi:ethanolamine ammonia-lyase small subunit
MNKQELSAMVAEILQNMEPMVKGSDYKPTTPGPQMADTHLHDGDFVEDVSKLDLRKLYLVDDPEDKQKFARLKERTPARLGAGRAGPRYKTLTMLRFRADHAAAQDAVFSQVAEDFAQKNDLVAVQTKCHDKDEYLTRPDLGRCFDEENQQKIRANISGTPKVQLVVGDGLSSAAITANAMDCAAAIRDGTYDFSLDDTACEPKEDELDDIPDELRETEEDAELDRRDEEFERKFNKVFTWVSIGAFAAVGAFIIWRLLDMWVF